jgi:hypothetical protein
MNAGKKKEKKEKKERKKYKKDILTLGRSISCLLGNTRLRFVL